jgi:hypothetical protein
MILLLNTVFMKLFSFLSVCIFSFFYTTTAFKTTDKNKPCFVWAPMEHPSDTNKRRVLNRDTSYPVINSVTSENPKVIMSAGTSALELSPLSTFNNGLLLEPVNRTLNRGVNTALFLKDTSSWTFYTDSKPRLTINGNGEIAVGSPLLINGAKADGVSALKVIGPAHFDSSIFIQSITDTGSFIALQRSIKNPFTEADDSISAYSNTPTAWALGRSLPVFRIRHPNNVSGIPDINTGIQKDFMILPYEYGMAIEYNGVVECWVGQWSIHKGVSYVDVEGKGKGWGAVLWVGDDIDGGGIRATARNNTSLGGNVAYGELSVEKFTGTPNGDFRFRLPSPQNQFQFVYGEKGSENIIAKMTNEGLVIPKITTVSAFSPEQGQIVFDSTERSFKGYNGYEWIDFSDSRIIDGSYNLSANGVDNTFLIPHGLTDLPSYYNVIATSENAGGFSYVTANAHYLVIHYTEPPQAGSANLSWNWQVKR